MLLEALVSRYDSSESEIYNLTARHLKNAPARLDNQKVGFVNF
jgi:hypothetical protein